MPWYDFLRCPCLNMEVEKLPPTVPKVPYIPKIDLETPKSHLGNSLEFALTRNRVRWVADEERFQNFTVRQIADHALNNTVTS